MTHDITVQPSGTRFSVPDAHSVLDAALASGVALPYGCRNGACASCKARVVSGAFRMGPHQPQSLTDAEREQGLALMCCTYPESDLCIESREVLRAHDMPIKKLPCRIADIAYPSPNVAVLRLQLSATERFQYLPGQYIELILRDGRRRSYSIANAPATAADETADHLELHIRHMPEGCFTDRLFGLGEPAVKPRDILRFEGPFGRSVLQVDSDKPIVFLASGTGFAPIKAMMETLIRRGDQRSTVLYWGARRPADLYAHEAVCAWAAELPWLRYEPVMSEALPEDAWTGRNGFVHEAVTIDLPDLSQHEVYACGAVPMVQAAQQAYTVHHGLPASAFYADAFTPAVDAIAVAGTSGADARA